MYYSLGSYQPQDTEWTDISGKRGANQNFQQAKSNETLWDGTTGTKNVYTVFNYTGYNDFTHKLPTLAYCNDYSAEFYFKAKASGDIQIAFYKRNVTPSNNAMLTADQVIFSISYVNTNGYVEKDAANPMTMKINMSDSETADLTGQQYYKVTLSVDNSEASYAIYPIVDNAVSGTAIKSGTITKGDIGGLFIYSQNGQTFRFDDILVKFMPTDNSVMPTATFSMIVNEGKYYPRYSISATDYNGATVVSPTLVKPEGAPYNISAQTIIPTGIGNSVVYVNSVAVDVSCVPCCIKAASFDLTNRDNLVTDNSHSLNSNNAPLSGFGTTNITRYVWQKSNKNSSEAKFLVNGFKGQGNYHQFYPGYGVNVTNASTSMVAKNSAEVTGMYTCLSYKYNESTEASGDGTAIYSVAPTKQAWASGRNTANLLKRDGDGSTFKGAIYTALDVYVPDGTTVTPTINATYGTSTFSYPYALDLSELTTMEAWTATEATNSVIKLTKQTGIVPAGTPLILTGTAEAIPLADISNASSVGTNYLKPVLDNDASKTVAQATDGSTNYVLSVQSEKVVFAPIGATSASVPYGNAYMNATPAGEARSLNIAFGDEVTGITNNNRDAITNNRYFDLQGREVAQPTHGLYIVNGKKVIIK